ncbi:MAG: lipocalin-like domain-containing protein [Anaerolineales bacterium]
MKRILWVFLLILAIAIGLFYAFGPRAEAEEISAQVLATPAPPSLGFERVVSSLSLSFPADFGPHLTYQTEWWYYTGNLETADGRHFGYQFTIFRRALIPVDQSFERSSHWAADQIYMGHLALSDVEGDQFHAFERFARGAAGLAGAESSPYHVWLEDWSITQSDENMYALIAEHEGIRLELQFTDEKGPVLQGDQGFSQKGPEPGNASFYYSQTRLQTEGEIRIGDESFQVSGLSWKDHEYSTSALAPDQVGWDWFSIQLDDGYELMLYQIRRADGSVDPFSSGALIAPDGSPTQLSREDFVIESQDSWHSPHSGADYPMGWAISIPAVELEINLDPYLVDQELNLSFIYWEGAVQVSGQNNGEAVCGVGYVEMTGYSQPFDGDF